MHGKVVQILEIGQIPIKGNSSTPDSLTPPPFKNARNLKITNTLLEYINILYNS